MEESTRVNEKTTSFSAALLGLVAAVPNWTAAGVFSLLGLAGGTAASVASSLTPVLIGVTAVLLGRAHYMLHVLKRGNRFSAVVTWLTTALVIGFWTWQWVLK